MELKKSNRSNIKLRLGISGSPGFGVTYSALQLAYGITKNWKKITCINTQSNSANLYSHLGDFNILNLSEPFSSNRFIEAISICENAGMEIIIVDSVSDEWQGNGGCLQMHKQSGGKFQNWAEISILHQAFIDKILQSTCHIITTTKRKVNYSLTVGSNGRTKVVKLGTKEITRQGFENMLMLNFVIINNQHQCKASIDRTGLFLNRPEFVITFATGKKLIEWLNKKPATEEELRQKIEECLSVSQLMELYKEHPSFQLPLKSLYQAKKDQLEELVKPQNFKSNGVSTSQ